MKWADFAACRKTPTRVFFEDAEQGGTEAFAICGRCPVRGECLEAALSDEAGLGPSYRYGVRGGLQPSLRYTVAQRAHMLRCRRCDALHDPLDLANGILRCTANCGEPSARAFKIEDEHGPWYPRLTPLGHTVLAWFAENIEAGAQVPSPTALSRELKQRKEDTVRVYQALVDDALLLRAGSRYLRGYVTIANVQTWRPLALRQAPVLEQSDN